MKFLSLLLLYDATRLKLCKGDVALK